MSTQVGRPVPHESAQGHVTGGARYVDDLCASMGRLVHAWPVMAPHAHARVLAIDTRQALALPGVCAVLGAHDVPGENDTGPVRHDEPLFPELVQFHGQPVAWVLGESEEQARLGAASVDVRYEPLTPLLSVADAIAAGSFLTDPDRIRRGEPEAALAS